MKTTSETNGHNRALRGNRHDDFSRSIAASLLRMSLICLMGAFVRAPAATPVQGNIVNGHWTKAGSPYLVEGNLTNASLTIDPGVQVLFQGDFVFEVAGTVTAVGTQTEPIIFTRLDQGGWQGIYFHNSPAGSVLRWCEISQSKNSGVRIVDSEPLLDCCTISQNSSPTNGGGIYAKLASGTLRMNGCDVSENVVNPSVSPVNGVGGGIVILGDTELTRCKIQNNKSLSLDTTFNSQITSVGGGLLLAGNARVKGCLISSNQVLAQAQSRASVYGAGIYLNSGTLHLENSILADNSLLAWAAFTNRRGSALVIDNAARADVVNSSIVYNGGSSAIYRYSGTLTVSNSIVYFNEGFPIDGSVNVAYSDVEGGYSGNGNINVNPLILDQTTFAVANGSPCIDAGDPAIGFRDVSFPPSLGGVRNDMGAYGGPGAVVWITKTTAPTIDVSPLSQAVCLGRNLILAVEAHGPAPLGYQWYRNGVALVGQTNGTLRVLKFAPDDAGSYTVTVSNAGGSVSSEAAEIRVADVCVDIQMYPGATAGITVSGQSGKTYVISYTTDLNASITWTPIATNTLASMEWFFVDGDSPSSPQRFYRVDPAN